MNKILVSKNISKFLGVQVVLCIVLSIVLKISMFYGAFGGLVISLTVLVSKGFTLKVLLKEVKRAIAECKLIFIIVFMMGAVVSIWLSSGTIPFIIYWGLHYISGKNIVLIAFLITGTVSFTMGTALGAFSTIGIALLAIGKAYDVPVPLMMGAILSGAFISDKMAPISGLVNLTLNLCKVKYAEYGKQALKTLIPVVILTILIFAFLGNSYVFNELTDEVIEIQNKLLMYFNLSPWLLALPILVITLAIFKVTTVRIMALSIMIGSSYCVFIQGLSINELWISILYGYRPPFDPQMAQIVSGGGVLPMVEVILIIFTVLTISYIFEYTGVTSQLTSGFTANLTSPKKLYFRTGLLSMIMTSITCDQSMGIIMPAKIMGSHFDQLGKRRAALAQIIADTGTIIAPLEFWNVNALIITALTGVSAFKYAPYTVFCYLTPLAWLVFVMMQKSEGSKLEEIKLMNNGEGNGDLKVL